MPQRLPRQGADIQHREFVFEEIGDAAGHFLQGFFQRSRIGFMQDCRNGNYSGNFDFDRFARFLHKSCSSMRRKVKENAGFPPGLGVHYTGWMRLR
jgi:hypothetical protein